MSTPSTHVETTSMSPDQTGVPTYPWAKLLAAAIGALVLALAFLSAYAGAFGNPHPHNLNLAVNGPSQVVSRLTDIDGVHTGTLTSSAQVTDAVKNRDADGGIIISPATKAKQPPAVKAVVATGAGKGTANAVIAMATQIATEMHTTVTTVEQTPMPEDNPNGSWEFYTIIFVGLGSSLGATALRAILGPIRSRRMFWQRLGTLVALTALLAAGVAIYVDNIQQALPDHWFALFASLWGFSLALGLAITGMAAAFGVVGGLLATLAFVVLGNSAAGGPAPKPMLNSFYRTLHGIVPQGAGVDLLRDIQYFDGDGKTAPLVCLLLWAVFGVILTAITSHGLLVSAANPAPMPAPLAGRRTSPVESASRPVAAVSAATPVVQQPMPPSSPTRQLPPTPTPTTTQSQNPQVIEGQIAWDQLPAEVRRFHGWDDTAQ